MEMISIIRYRLIRSLENVLWQVSESTVLRSVSYYNSLLSSTVVDNLKVSFYIKRILYMDPCKSAFVFHSFDNVFIISSSKIHFFSVSAPLTLLLLDAFHMRFAVTI